MEKLEDFRCRRQSDHSSRDLYGDRHPARCFLIHRHRRLSLAGPHARRVADHLSYLGYAVVVLAAYARPGFYWSCQAAENCPLDLTTVGAQEDLLSAVNLKRKGVESDSEIFRKLVQKDVSSRVRTLDMTSTLPLARLRKWLIATAGLIAMTLILLYNPNFGGKFQRAIGRALMPGANIAAVTDVEVTILAPEKTLLLPSKASLRFLIAVTAKERTVLRFGRI